VSGITSSTALWYASRATGVVCLLLFTLVTLLGILVNRQGRLPGLPRFAVTGLHRSLALLAVVFLAIHVLTAVADSYVTIQLAAAVIPFVSRYQPVQMGLGAVALDLIAALVITSLLRARMNRRLWRGVHWLAYAAYPLTVLHSVTSSADLRSGGLLGLTAACVLSVAVALTWRVTGGRRAAVLATPPRPAGVARPPRLAAGPAPSSSGPAAGIPVPREGAGR
jgi:DMSO/TMAO reductase YedYZ heme-binding membrane subunit